MNNNIIKMEENKIISKKGFTIENLNPQIGKIYPISDTSDFTGYDRNILVLDFGKKKLGDLATVSLLFSEDFKITRTSASCGCTVPSYKVLEDGKKLVTIQFDPYKIANKISKFVYLHNGDDTFKINLIINS